MSNIITPIIIPMHTPPPRCPGCNNLENVKTVCANCGYEYEDEAYPKWKVGMWIFVLLLGVYLLMTILVWLTDYQKPTLFEIFKMQWEWFKELRVW